jgi:hypothetical protein
VTLSDRELQSLFETRGLDAVIVRPTASRRQDVVEGRVFEIVPLEAGDEVTGTWRSSNAMGMSSAMRSGRT